MGNDGEARDVPKTKRGELKKRGGKSTSLRRVKWTLTPSTLPCAALKWAVLFLFSSLSNFLGTAAVQVMWPFHYTTKFKPCKKLGSDSSLPSACMTWGQVH